MKSLGCLFILLLLLPFPRIGFAQAVDVPPSAEPSQIERDFKKELTPKATSDAVVVKSEKPPARSEMEKINFVLRKVRFKGNTVYRNQKFFPFYKRLIGQEISLATLYEIASKITVRYRKDGYILSRAIIPPQSIRHGVAQIRIVEGYIDEVVVKGSKKIPEVYTRKIKRSRPLRSRTLERYLLTIDDLPGVKVKSVLTPSKNNPGASVLTILFERQALGAFFGADNRGSKYNGPYHFSTGGNINGLLGLYSRTGFHFVTSTPMEEIIFVHGSHDQQLNSKGTKFATSVTFGSTKPGHTLEPFNVEGESLTISATLSQPIIRSRRTNFSASVSLAIKNSKTDILKALDFEDRIRVFTFSTSFDAVDNWKGINLIQLHVSQGFNAFGARKTGSANLSRALGRSNFTKVSGGFLRLQQIGSHLTLLNEVAGQYAFDNLLSSEEFSVGGSRFGRGYDSSEISGTNGIAYKTELQYKAQVGRKLLKDIQPYLFYDVGMVAHKDSAAGRPDLEQIQSAGGGVRIKFLKQLFASFELAKPLSRIVEAESDKNIRFFFKVFSRFGS